jgi:hypothetical protein
MKPAQVTAFKRFAGGCAVGIVVVSYLLPCPVQALDFTYTNYEGAVTITGYTGPGGNVTVPSTIEGLPVKAIGDHAFYYVPTLTGVIIPEGVTKIGFEAFWSSDKLLSVSLPNGLLNIGDQAFWACSSLGEVTIPASVTNIGALAFGKCTSLGAITVDPLNVWYASVEGVLFDNGQKTLIQFPGGKAGSYTIPTSVTSIADLAFWWSTNLSSVTMPEGVNRIGVDAFGGCAGLISVSMPNSLTIIDDSAFWGCTMLSQAPIPNGVTRIGSSAFSQCGLTKITIPPSVMALGDAAFSSCTSVTSLDIENSFLGTNEFSGCTGVMSITIPDWITDIANGAFAGTGLTNVAIPRSITRVGDFAFEGCTSLTNIAIPDTVTYIGGGAFAFCNGLTSVTIPDSVTRIGDGLISKGVVGAFSYCTNLTNVVLGNRLQHIGDGAFFGCSDLAAITIPESVTRIGDVCFAYSPNLTAVYFEGDAPDISLSAFELLSQPTPATLYYLPGTVGWAPTVANRPTALWVRPTPVILTTGPSFGAHADGFGFRVSWATNAAVVVEACTNLHNPVWEALLNRPLTDGVVDFRDLQWTNHPNRFYRVRWP